MFKFNTDGRPVPMSGGGVANIKIRYPETNKQMIIKMLNIIKAHKIPGHYKAPEKQKGEKYFNSNNANLITKK